MFDILGARTSMRVVNISALFQKLSPTPRLLSSNIVTTVVFNPRLGNVIGTVLRAACNLHT